MTLDDEVRRLAQDIIDHGEHDPVPVGLWEQPEVEKLARWCLDRLAAGAEPPKPTWQPIESAPRDGNRFLGLWQNGNNVQYVTAKKSKNGGPWTDEFELYNYSSFLTHWMPLPDAPPGDST